MLDPQTQPPAPAKPEPEVMKYFAFEHLPSHLRAVSQPFGELARKMVAELPPGRELEKGLDKLLEAKDCFVRAKL